MNFIIDLILAAALIGGVVLGITRGFIRSIAKPFRVIAAFFMAFWLCSGVGTALLQPMVEPTMANQLYRFFEDKCDLITTENVPTLLKLAASLCNVEIDAYIGETYSETATMLSTALAEPTSRILSVILAFVALFILSTLLFALILKLVDMFLEGGPLKIVNRALGCLCGLALGFTAAWAISSFFNFIISTPLLAEREWVQNFTGGFLYRFFLNFDPLRLLLSF